MRFIKYIVVLALVLSLIGNYFLYRRNEKYRPQVKINEKTVTMKEYHDWLEQSFGTPTMARMMKYNLIMQAAQKANLAPKPEDVEKKLEEKKEANPRIAVEFKRN